ncbi:MAG: hypothetical protein P4L40_25760 [Terracidiphilus sp.]|nr:hypothetical protein [Terracidiphilus sp.]
MCECVYVSACVHGRVCLCVVCVFPLLAQADIFSQYFRDAGFNVGYIEARGSMYPVQTYYLEDVLEVCACVVLQAPW